MSEPLLLDKVQSEVNKYINKADIQTIVKIVTEVFRREWDYFKYRNVVRLEGYDVNVAKAIRTFYGIYNDATAQEIVDIYNLMNNTKFKVNEYNVLVPMEG